MFDKQIKRKYKIEAQKKSFKIAFIITTIIAELNIISFGHEDGVVTLSQLAIGLVLALIVSAPYAVWSNMTKKQYLKKMQKHIMENIANANDPLEIQKMQVAMTYYGNKMTATQMQEIKAAASASAYSQSSSHASVTVNHR